MSAGHSHELIADWGRKGALVFLDPLPYLHDLHYYLQKVMGYGPTIDLRHVTYELQVASNTPLEACGLCGRLVQCIANHPHKPYASNGVFEAMGSGTRTLATCTVDFTCV
jgi:hypothetical protein